MEEQVYRKLSKSEQALLKELGETQVFRAIAKAVDIYQQDKAQHIALMAPDMANVFINRGNIHGARFIYDLVKYAEKKQKKA